MSVDCKDGVSPLLPQLSFADLITRNLLTAHCVTGIGNMT